MELQTGDQDDVGSHSCHLPCELLVLVLSRVPFLHRLTSCALVDTSWQAAAAAATQAVQLRSNSKTSTSNVQKWLSRRGESITSVQLCANYHNTSVELLFETWNCPKLRNLNLAHFTLNTPDIPDSSSPSNSPGRSSTSSFSPVAPRNLSILAYVDSTGFDDAPISGDLQQTPSVLTSSFACLTNLTNLSLQYCCINTLNSLAAVTGLKHLRIEKPQPLGIGAAGASTALEASPLAALQSLTSLHIIKGCYHALLHSLCSLTGLQDLQLVRCRDTQSSSYPHLWQYLLGLTSLQTEGLPMVAPKGSTRLEHPSTSSSTTTSSSSSSSSSSMTALRGSSGSKHTAAGSSWRARPWQLLERLEVTAAGAFDPLLLAPAVRMRHLHITSTYLAGGSAGTTALLSVIAQMTNLQDLNLKGTLQQVALSTASAASDNLDAALDLSRSWEAYAALTASSKLHCLDLSRCVLPAVAAQAMFLGSGRSCAKNSARLSRLQDLVLTDTFCLKDVDDLRNLVGACPSLRNLDITRATAHDKRLPDGMLGMLTELQQLTSLNLCKVGDAAAVELACLTQLRSLGIVWQSSITDQGVQQLTALKNLTQLWVHGGLSSRLAPGYLISLHSKSSPPDVWCQLQQACRIASSRCR